MKNRRKYLKPFEFEIKDNFFESIKIDDKI